MGGIYRAMYSKSTYDGGIYNVPESYGGVAFGNDRTYRPLSENVQSRTQSEPPREVKTAERLPEEASAGGHGSERECACDHDAVCKHGECGVESAKRPESRFSLDLSGDDILLAVIILLLRDGEKSHRGGESCDDVIMLLLLLLFLR